MQSLEIVLWILAVNITFSNVMGIYSMIKRRQMRLQQQQQPKKNCPNCRRNAVNNQGNEPALTIPDNPKGIPYPVVNPTMNEVVAGLSGN